MSQTTSSLSLSEDVEKQVSDQIGPRLRSLLSLTQTGEYSLPRPGGEGIRARGGYEIAETFAVCTVKAKALQPGKIKYDSFDDLITPIGRWHFQIRRKDNHQPIGYARSRKATEEEVALLKTDQIVTQVSLLRDTSEKSTNDEKQAFALALDRAVTLLDAYVIEGTVAKLVEVPSHKIRAIVVEDEHNPRQVHIAVISSLPLSLKKALGIDEDYVCDASEFLSLLRRIPRVKVPMLEGKE
jgi:hypothetical protein